MNKGSIALLAFAGLCFPRAAAGQQGIVVDHTSLGLFDQIPENYLQAARNLRVLFMNRSVGVNTNEALDCFTAADYGSSSPACRKDYQWVNGAWQLVLRSNSDLAMGLVPPYIRFNPSATRYNRSNWKFYWFAAEWELMTTEFVSGLHNRAIPAIVDSYTNQSILLNPLDFDVLSFQFSYLNVMEGSTITNFFTRRPGDFDDAYDLEREVGEVLSSANPPRVFVYWTTSLSRAIGTQESTNFNQQMRQWCQANNKILFDFADIEAHDMAGRPCYDNRDGIPYTGNAGSEDYPDDGLNLPAICQEKTTEHNGGHLATAQAKVSVAKGFWVLVARIAGWNPGGAAVPSAPRHLRLGPQ